MRTMAGEVVDELELNSFDDQEEEDDPYEVYVLRRPHERSSAVVPQLPKQPEMADTRLRYRRIPAEARSGSLCSLGNHFPRRFEFPNRPSLLESLTSDDESNASSFLGPRDFSSRRRTSSQHYLPLPPRHLHPSIRDVAASSRDSQLKKGDAQKAKPLLISYLDRHGIDASDEEIHYAPMTHTRDDEKKRPMGKRKRKKKRAPKSLAMKPLDSEIADRHINLMDTELEFALMPSSPSSSPSPLSSPSKLTPSCDSHSLERTPSESRSQPTSPLSASAEAEVTPEIGAIHIPFATNKRRSSSYGRSPPRPSATTTIDVENDADGSFDVLQSGEYSLTGEDRAVMKTRERRPRLSSSPERASERCDAPQRVGTTANTTHTASREISSGRARGKHDDVSTSAHNTSSKRSSSKASTAPFTEWEGRRISPPAVLSPSLRKEFTLLVEEPVLYSREPKPRSEARSSKRKKSRRKKIAKSSARFRPSIILNARGSRHSKTRDRDAVGAGTTSRAPRDAQQQGVDRERELSLSMRFHARTPHTTTAGPLVALRKALQALRITTRGAGGGERRR